MTATHEVVSHADWLERRVAFLEKEKEFTRLRDRLAQERAALPWERVDKRYVFRSAAGDETLSDLFGGSSQLIVYHFMFGPDWDAGCRGCSFWADNFNGIDVHLKHRDVALVAVSRGPLEKLAAYAARMAWTFKWVSSAGNDFNFDYQVSFREDDIGRGAAVYNYARFEESDTERPGVSVFFKDADGQIFHTYSAYARGIDILNGAYHYLDIAPKGRDEGDRAAYWLRRRDEYDLADADA
jgi:predicted dithiol-disulfide oxidoreductase (DUF899 family)